VTAEFLRFCAVGGVGFVVDGGLLTLLMEVFGLGPYSARVVSFLSAATVTWLLHRNFTFRRTEGSRRRQWVRFLAVNGIGAVLNYGVYAACVAFAPHPVSVPQVALVVGAALALGFNYLSSRFYVFAAAPETGP